MASTDARRGGPFAFYRETLGPTETLTWVMPVLKYETGVQCLVLRRSRTGKREELTAMIEWRPALKQEGA